MSTDDRPADTSTNTVLIIIGVIVGVLLLLVLGCGVASYFFIRSVSGAMAPAMQALAEIQNGDAAAQTFLNNLAASPF
jgi:hypothetical protein